MKNLMALCVVAVVAVGSVVRAEDAKDAKPKKEPMCCQFMHHSEMLTKEQKDKATALHADCAKAHCSKKAQETFFSGVKATLTAEQIAACKADCEKNKRTGCPICSEPKAKKKS